MGQSNEALFRIIGKFADIGPTHIRLYNYNYDNRSCMFLDEFKAYSLIRF